MQVWCLMQGKQVLARTRFPHVLAEEWNVDGSSLPPHQAAAP